VEGRAAQASAPHRRGEQRRLRGTRLGHYGLPYQVHDFPPEVAGDERYRHILGLCLLAATYVAVDQQDVFDHLSGAALGFKSLPQALGDGLAAASAQGSSQRMTPALRIWIARMTRSGVPGP
jgi:hypothetical protein